MAKLTPIEIIKELSDNYWESWVLDEHVKKKERGSFLWQAVRDELVPADPGALWLLAEHPEGADAEATVKLLAEAPLDEAYRGVKGWDGSYEDLLEVVAEHDGQRLKEHYERLPDPIDDLAAIALLRHGLINGISEKTARNLAVAYLEDGHKSGFFEVIDKSGINPFIYDDVEDRGVSTLGFEATVELDYGPRSFEARLGPGATLTLCTAEGKHYKSAPKATKSDDADKAADAKERFKQLKAALKRLVKQQSHRLQDAMVAGRPWSAAQFRALFVEHPVMRQLACGLVFQVNADALLRCTADGDLVDADYGQVTLPADARLTLVHPLELEPEPLKAWDQHLADAELLQPFPQFGRPTYAVSDGPQAYGEAKPVAVCARLRDLGWRNSRAEDTGMVYEAQRLLFGRSVRAEINHGGFYIGDPSWGDEPISVEGLRFYDLEGQELTPEQVEPVAYSEVLYELQRVAPLR